MPAEDDDDELVLHARYFLTLVRKVENVDTESDQWDLPNDTIARIRDIHKKRAIILVFLNSVCVSFVILGLLFLILGIWDLAFPVLVVAAIMLVCTGVMISCVWNIGPKLRALFFKRAAAWIGHVFIQIQSKAVAEDFLMALTVLTTVATAIMTLILIFIWDLKDNKAYCTSLFLLGVASIVGVCTRGVRNRICHAIGYVEVPPTISV